MHELTTSFVLGYHGCDRAVAHALIAGDDFRYETNEWDWLGSGVYFWESNPLRGIEYAYELKAYPRKTKGSVNDPAVVGAVIGLGFASISNRPWESARSRRATNISSCFAVTRIELFQRTKVARIG